MRFYLSSAEKRLQFHACGNMIDNDNFRYQRSKQKYYVLIMVKEGTLYLTQNGMNHEIRKNQYIFLKPEEEQYGYRCSVGKLSYVWVKFSFREPVIIHRNSKFMNDYVKTGAQKYEDSFYVVPEHGEVSMAQRIPLLFNQLLDISRQENFYSDMAADYALSLLMMELSQEYMETKYNLRNTISPNLDRIMEWIKANYDKEITIKELAGEMGYNPNYLSSLFKKTTGITLVQYINNTRINIAKSMIVEHDKTIKEVAYACGYINEKYFMKVFKKVEGMTPSQYKSAFTRKTINSGRSKVI